MKSIDNLSANLPKDATASLKEQLMIQDYNQIMSYKGITENATVAVATDDILLDLELINSVCSGILGIDD